MATRVIRLAWTESSSNEDGFTIQRKDGPCASAASWVDIGSVPANTTAFTDPTSPLPAACYRVRATSAALGDSGYSNELGAVLPQAGGERRGLSRR